MNAKALAARERAAPARVAGHRLVVGPLAGPWGRSFLAIRKEDGRLVHLTLVPRGPEGAAIRRLFHVAASLDHPHLVRVEYAIDPAAGPFATVELPAGRSVRALLRRRGVFGTSEADAIARAVESALRHLAGVGLGHGSVTTRAIVIHPDGTPKLRGFLSDRFLYADSAPAAAAPADLASDLEDLARVRAEMLESPGQRHLP